MMKKTYSAPKTITVVISSKCTLMSGSPTASGLDGFEGNGGGMTGGSADSRRGSFWDDDDE